MLFFFFSSRRRHTRCALVTGVQTWALPIYSAHSARNNDFLRSQESIIALSRRLLAPSGPLSPPHAVDRPDGLYPLLAIARSDAFKIGRASCRERVCPYV